tara:strand:+ start:1745 stop:1936 length:192 start_codon:yes stop_codon:yes gene_type:complete
MHSQAVFGQMGIRKSKSTYQAKKKYMRDKFIIDKLSLVFQRLCNHQPLFFSPTGQIGTKKNLK